MEKDEARSCLFGLKMCIISVRIAVKISEVQKLWKQDAMAVSSGAEESSPQQKTSASLGR